jgi:hypothetical protein
MPIEEQDLTNIMVTGMPLGLYLVKTRLDMLTNFLIPEGCKDRERFEMDFQSFLGDFTAQLNEQKMKAQLRGNLTVPEEKPTGLIVP